jgi:multidrug efflux pump subunit AcrA (membrane-fusion protein)
MAKKRWTWVLGAAVIGTGGVAGYATRGQWLPLVSHTVAKEATTAGREHDDGHGHDHDHDASQPVNHVDLTDQARRNLGLEINEVALQDYWRTVSIPGVVAEEPGHCERRISTTVNGIILKVHALQGQTVKPGDALFDIQPTSDLLTNAQSSLLKTLQDLEIAAAELERLRPQVASGTLASNLFKFK